MKKLLYFTLILSVFSSNITGQQYNNSELPTSINDNGNAPASSAILDLQSLNKGLLTPRLSTAQRNTIANPATGLLVYDTDLSAFYFFDGSVWASVGGDAVSVNNPEGAIVYSSNDYNLPNSSWDIVPFDNVIMDLNNSFNSSTYQFIVQESGVYQINFSVAFSNTFSFPSLQVLSVDIRVNGISVKSKYDRHDFTYSPFTIDGNRLIQLNTNDIVDIRALQITGTTIKILTGGSRTYFDVIKIE